MPCIIQWLRAGYGLSVMLLMPRKEKLAAEPAPLLFMSTILVENCRVKHDLKNFQNSAGFFNALPWPEAEKIPFNYCLAEKHIKNGSQR